MAVSKLYRSAHQSYTVVAEENDAVATVIIDAMKPVRGNDRVNHTLTCPFVVQHVLHRTS